MAYISKIKMSPTSDALVLKDAEARLMLAGFNITEGAVKTYIDEQVAGVNFEATVYDTYEDLPTASEDTMHILALVPDDEAAAGTYIEYITAKTGDEAPYTYTWEQIGTTELDLSNYLTEVSYSNGTLSYTNGDGTTEVHTFGALADKSSASGSYTKPTGSGSVTIPATYTFAGTEDQTVSVTGSVDTYEASTETINVNYTQATVVGSVTETTDTVSVTATGGSVTNGSAASFTQGTDSFTQGEDTFTANTPTAIDTTKFSGGSKAADTFTAGSLPSKAADTFSAGTLASKAADTFNAGSLPSLGTASTGSFATEGVTVSVGTGDDAETLIFGTATTSSAVTAQGTFNAGSLPTFTEGTFTQGTLPSFTEGAFNAGSLPTFSEGAFTPASLASGFYTPGTAATFEQGTDSFSQGNDSFTANTPTAVTLPTAYETESVVTAISITETTVAADAFLADEDGSSTGPKEVVTGISTGEAATITSTGTFTATGSVTTATTESATVTVGTTSDTVTVS